MLGIDLVRAQIEVARGKTLDELGLAQARHAPGARERRHARLRRRQPVAPGSQEGPEGGAVGGHALTVGRGAGRSVVLA